MRRKLRLTIAYDGTDFHGWQRQPGLRTVQGELEAVVWRVVRHPADVVGASRTDAGVHARGQCAQLVTDSAIPDENLLRAINHRLPADLTIVRITRVRDDFDAIRSAVGKLYRYRIYNTPRSPVVDLVQRCTWHVPFRLDIAAMRAAAAGLVGRHDFSSFASAGCTRENKIRSVHEVSIRLSGPEISIDVAGDGFLYNQVRNMVGTLVEVGRGHWGPGRVAEILAGRDRRLAGPTAPPQGLCLEQVWYPASVETGE